MTFNSVKIDKLRFSYKKKNISFEKRIKIYEKLKTSFPDSTTSSKAGYILHTLTPTKAIREGINNNHNLQMPSEKVLYEILNEITLNNPEIQTEIHNTLIHLAKDIVLKNPVNEVIDYLEKQSYAYLEPEYKHSNGQPSLYLHYHHSPDSEGGTKFVIKLYDKVAEYFKRHKTYLCELYEPLSPEEIELVGDAYDEDKNTLNLEHLNILRIEIEYHETKKILPITKLLNPDSEVLLLPIILNSLKAGIFYNTAEQIFNNTLKKYVFTANDTFETATAELSNIRKLACECLINNQDYFQFKAVAEELGLQNQFSELDFIVRKVIPDSAIYNELYNALFPFRIDKESREEKKSIRCCNTYNSDILKHFMLIYEVPIFDDS